jgi:hypothetical protein
MAFAAVHTGKLSVQAQAPSTQTDSVSKGTVALPEWQMSDEDHKALLLRIEAVIPIYESSLDDIEAYLNKHSSVPYRAGKVIHDDIASGRSDMENLRKWIATVRGSRDVLGEIDLAATLRDIAREELEIERDEIDITFVESEQNLTFPSPSGLRGCHSQFLSFARELEHDYAARIFFLEVQASHGRTKK